MTGVEIGLLITQVTFGGMTGCLLIRWLSWRRAWALTGTVTVFALAGVLLALA